MRIDWEIIGKSISGNLSEEEKSQFDKWLNGSSEHLKFYNAVRVRKQKKDGSGLSDSDLKQYRRQYTHKIDELAKQGRRVGLRFLYYAASFVIPLIIATLFILNSQKNNFISVSEKLEIKPGESKAVLITAKGKKVLLDSISKHLPVEDGVEIKAVGNSLIYTGSNDIVDKVPENKLVIPRGGEYRLVLADGTKVWLNADSELRYPVSFMGNIRKVYLKGEAYFDVTHNKEMPFVVVTDNLDVKVYGTEFNVNTHREDIVQTTLVEGSVSVKIKGQKEVVISPFQMAELNVRKGDLNIRTVDVENYVAWRYGEYVFDNQSLELILEELSLWYDVEIFYMNKVVKDLHFSGYLKKYDSIDKILNLIERTTHVKFEIKGKAIYVKK